MTPPETRYAKSGDLRIAYQIVGNGPFDLVFVPGFASNIDAIWEMPPQARFHSRLASFSRLILFDKRGTGLSDRSAGIATLEERMDDVRAVMDAAGSERAALFWRFGRRADECLVRRHLSGSRERACPLRKLRAEL